MFAWISIKDEPRRAFIVSRVFLIGITLLAISLAAGKHDIPFNSHFIAPEVLQHNNPFDALAYVTAWWRWDNVRYVEMAAYGYQADLAVFFPLWPATIWLLGRPLSLLLPGEIPYYLSSILLSNLFFFISLQLLYQLTRRFFDTTIAKTTVWLLAFFPYTLFFSFGYTESLFLCLCLATFVFLEWGRMRDWWLAGICAGLAATTREAGVLIVVPVLVFLLQRFWPLGQSLRMRTLEVINATCSLLLIPLGTISYMLYLYLHWGNPFLFLHAAIAWGRYPAFPLTPLFSALWSLATLSVPPKFLYNIVLDLCFTLLPLFLLLKYWRFLPFSYALFTLTLIVYTLSTTAGFPDPLMSAPRYLIVIFPTMMLLALECKRNRTFRRFITIIFPLALAVNVALFAIGLWIA